MEVFQSDAQRSRPSSRSSMRSSSPNPFRSSSASVSESMRSGRTLDRSFGSSSRLKGRPRSTTPTGFGSSSPTKRDPCGDDDASVVSASSAPAPSSKFVVNCVFDRLALQGVVAAQKYRSWTPPPKSVRPYIHIKRVYLEANLFLFVVVYIFFPIGRLPTCHSRPIPRVRRQIPRTRRKIWSRISHALAVIVLFAA